MWIKTVYNLKIVLKPLIAKLWSDITVESSSRTSVFMYTVCYWMRGFMNDCTDIGELKRHTKHEVINVVSCGREVAFESNSSLDGSWFSSLERTSPARKQTCLPSCWITATQLNHISRTTSFKLLPSSWSVECCKVDIKNLDRFSALLRILMEMFCIR